MVELLISKHHAEVDVRAEGQLTPLHWAAYCGHPDVVTTLLQHDADLTAVDESGVHALDYAIKMGHRSVCNDFIRYLLVSLCMTIILSMCAILVLCH